MNILLIVLLGFISCLSVNAFLSASPDQNQIQNKNRIGNAKSLPLRSPQQFHPLFLSEDVSWLGEGSDTLADDDSQSLLKSLNERKKQLEQGIGKRFRCHTQKGFLNVHMEPGDPFNTANIVDQLEEGEIVTSVAPPRGPWIKHNKGGWSISIYYGHVWLQELKE